MSGIGSMMLSAFKPAPAGAAVSSASMDNEPAVAYSTLSGNYTGSTVGTGDFTAECWIYNTNVHDNQCFIETGSNANGGSGFRIRTLVDGSYPSGIMYVYGGGTFSANGITANTWVHVAASRISNTTKIFIDGVQKGSVTDNGNYTNDTWRVGGYWGNFNGTVPWVFRGYIDEWRLSNIGRYSGNFTPSTSSFTSDTNTLLLLHMDGENGGTTFTDSSSFNRTVTRDSGNPTTTTEYFKF